MVDYTVSDFVDAVFAAFEDAGIRYCVLHAWDSLPDGLPSDLDIGVHPEDKSKIPVVLRRLTRKGFLAVDCHLYEVAAWSFIFSWFWGHERLAVVLDIIVEYRTRWGTLVSGQDLVAGRTRLRSFWIPAPETALQYLLAKRTLKKTFLDDHREEIRRSTIELGRPRSEAIAAKLFGEKLKGRVVDACQQDSLNSLTGELRSALFWNVVSRRPWNTVLCLAAEACRIGLRIAQPTGVFLAFLGPDGSGKSTVLNKLLDQPWFEFQSRRVFHWRPQCIAKKPDLGPVTDPHGKPARGSIGSCVRLFGFVLDYWAGYIFTIRPKLVRSGLVIFDRYFDDMAIDPRRYRYGGPVWLPRVLTRLIPRPDIYIVLDAQEDRMFLRKQEVSAEELVRLRRAYVAFAGRQSTAVLVSTDGVVEEAAAASSRAVCTWMNGRFTDRFRRWKVGGPEPGMASSRGSD
jgi:thymidylate kinase